MSPLTEDTIQQAKADSRDTRGHRRLTMLAVLGIVACVLLFGVAAWLVFEGDTLRQQVDTVSSQQAHAATVAQQLASQLRGMGATPVASPPAPVTGQPGPSGAAGPSGPAGRGISSTVITGGHLIVGYTDGSTTDEGQVVGASGTGITSSVVNSSGHLILTYSSGAVDDVGAVVGPAGATGATGAAGTPGCGIASVGESSGDLVVNYTGSTCATTSAVVGPLPAGPVGPTGPAGATGATGPPPYSWTWTDELGTRYVCTENPDDPPGTQSPTYVCNPQSAKPAVKAGH